MEMGKEFASYLLEEMDLEIASSEIPELSRQRMQNKIDKLRGIVDNVFGGSQPSANRRRGGGANA